MSQKYQSYVDTTSACQESSRDVKPSTRATNDENQTKYLPLDTSFRLGYGLPIREDTAEVKEWDYKGRTALESRPFRFPIHPLETVWRRPPHRSLATLYKPWKAEVSLADVNVQSSYPTDSGSFSGQDFVLKPAHTEILTQRPRTAPTLNWADGAESLNTSLVPKRPGSKADATLMKKPSVIRSPLPPPPLACPRPGTAPHNTLTLRKTAAEAAVDSLPALAQPRGRDPNAMHTGYRLIERAGQQTFKDAVTYDVDAPFLERPTIKVYLQELQEKEEAWQKKESERETDMQHSDKQVNQSTLDPSHPVSSSTVADRFGEVPYDPMAAFATVEMQRAMRDRPSAAETVARIAAHKSFPRPSPPHPMWKTTYMTLGHVPEYSEVPPKAVTYPRLQSFSNSFQYQKVGPPRNRGLNTHVPRPSIDKVY